MYLRFPTFALVCVVFSSASLAAQDEPILRKLYDRHELKFPKLFDRPVPKILPDDDELRQLLVKRHKATTEELKAWVRAYLAGSPSSGRPESVATRWVASCQEVYADPALRLEVVKEYVDFMKAIEGVMQHQLSKGTVGTYDAEHIRALSLDAQVQYLRLKRQVDKSK